MARRLAALAVVAAATAFTAPAASASLYCNDVLGIEGSGFGPVCVVTCALQADPQVDPAKPDVRGQLPGCFFTD